MSQDSTSMLDQFESDQNLRGPRVICSRRRASPAAARLCCCRMRPAPGTDRLTDGLWARHCFNVFTAYADCVIFGRSLMMLLGNRGRVVRPRAACGRRSDLFCIVAARCVVYTSCFVDDVMSTSVSCGGVTPWQPGDTCRSHVCSCAPRGALAGPARRLAGGEVCYAQLPYLVLKQEAQLSPRDRAMRRVSWNLANRQATAHKLLVRQVLNQLSAVANWTARQNRAVDRAWGCLR